MIFRFCSQTQSLMIQFNLIKKSLNYSNKSQQTNNKKKLVVNQATYLMFYDSIDELFKITQPQRQIESERERDEKMYQWNIDQSVANFTLDYTQI